MNKYKNTYCNPLSLPDYEKIEEDWPFQGQYIPVTKGYSGAEKPFFDVSRRPFRSVADPDVLYYEGKWYIYGSTDVCYVSDELLNWKAYPLKPHRFDVTERAGYSEDIDIFTKRYHSSWIAVAVTCFKGKIYLLPSGSATLYTADNPLGTFVKAGDIVYPDGTNCSDIPDPAFLADGDRLYLYFGSGIETGIQGVELDADKPWKMKQKPVRLVEFEAETGWECTGARYENKKVGWIEGGGALKKNGRYYLYFSANGVTYDSYNMGCYYSDESALSGFKPQKNNPFCEKTKGICKAAGHGSITTGPNDTMWIFYTSVASSVHMYERRIGMDKVVINADGELEVITTDTPQWAPGIIGKEQADNSTDLYPLTFQNPAWATSAAPGRDPIYVTDESMATWWEHDEGDNVRQIIVNLRADYEVSASRVLWKEIGENYGPIKYKIELADDYETDEWRLALDMSENDEDYLNDYRTFDAKKGRYAKLTIVDIPKDMKIGVISFTVFGKNS